MLRLKRPIAFVAAALAVAAAPAALADIYSFKDEKGVVHFTNIKDLDPRYKLIRREAASAPGLAPAAMRAFTASATDIKKYSGIVDNAAKAYGVEAPLIHAVISAESGYNPYALSRTGAMGIMQLMPDTARRYGVQNIMDPVENIHGGAKYLRDLLAMFKGRVDLALAGYNAGENAVIRHGLNIPPYAETRTYVPKVLGFYKNLRAQRG